MVATSVNLGRSRDRGSSPLGTGLCWAMTREALIRIIAAWAAGHPEVLEVVLFGSRARGDHRPDSDVDLAVRAASPDNRTPLGVYIQHCQEWRSELAGMFGLG
ncbi:MAG: uncharacterized protein JWP44_4843, partial [Mucilaginibacter sp.]|nr:uncharacterized protein [Mucilaginibacter sp.]